MRKQIIALTTAFTSIFLLNGAPAQTTASQSAEVTPAAVEAVNPATTSPAEANIITTPTPAPTPEVTPSPTPESTPAPPPDPAPEPSPTPTPTPTATPIPTETPKPSPTVAPQPTAVPATQDLPSNDAMTTEASKETKTTQTTAAAEPTSVTLPDGLVYQVLRPGTGREADTTSTRLLQYSLYLPDGTKIESSRDKQLPVPFRFTPGASEAIIGMQEGTNGMRIGEIRKLYVPATLAYGENAHGAVPANSDLVFEVELVDLKTPDARNNEEEMAAESQMGSEH